MRKLLKIYVFIGLVLLLIISCNTITIINSVDSICYNATKINSLDSLIEGKYVVSVCENSTYIGLSNSSGRSNPATEQFNVSEDSIKDVPLTLIWDFKKNGDKWEIKVGENYLYSTNSNSALKVYSKSLSWTVTYDSDKSCFTINFLASDSTTRNLSCVSSSNYWRTYNNSETGNKEILLFLCEEVERTNCEVSFDTDGGTIIDSQIVNIGEKASAPSIPTKDGYIFDGWYTSSNFDTEFDFEQIIQSNITIYAKWIITNRLIFEELTTKSSMKMEYSSQNIDIETTSCTLSYAGETSNLREDENYAYMFGLNSNIFSVYGIKNTPTNNVGINKDGTIRLYGNEDQNGNELKVTSSSQILITSIKIILHSSTETTDYQINTDVSPVVENEGLEKTFNFDVPINTFTIKNNNVGTDIVKISSIDITYLGVGKTYSVSSSAIRFGTCISKELYDGLVTDGATEFGVVFAKKTLLGDNDLVLGGTNVKYMQCTPVRVASAGATEEDTNGNYYQFAVVLSGMQTTDFDTEVVAACYVKIGETYYYMTSCEYSMKSLANKYLSDNLAPGFEGILNHIANN